MNRRKLREAAAGYLFLLPTLLVIGTFLLAPIVYALFLSFHKVQLLGGISYRFIDFDNYVRMGADDRVWIALYNTFEYAIIVVPLQTALAILLAAVLNSKLRGRNAFRILYFLPTVTSSAVLTLIFMWIFKTDGLLNDLLGVFGIQPFNWLGDPKVALKGIMLMNVWSTAPYFMVIYLAALQDIPDSLYEAAEIDGARTLRKFWSITLPLLKPVTFFVVTMGIIGTFQLFDQAYIFSNGSGGPNNSTLTVVLLIYQYAFKNLDMGYAAALAVMLAAVIMLVTVIQRRIFGEEKLN
ncbi:CUT1 family carbohydrate ABC transporter, TC 3.A.1.1.-, membrane protein [Thermobacillus xylanilyticus]|jgi:ABC-type sugar transport systems, permease components|uniref:CUT1 family carbohydrate ABC transporter, TC 3.A.1.1.-, membrane protein n=1 Tax=Thermobacillus xylanilyticus TaxID=76633 RepID=A0ABM8V4B8_THEXY|nr:sugar ABC transporter permease [Thermobacillus xylanilyticus]REJ16339.1 MAG: sugar ABC transporter permease [Paenibacillaceae bacterium]CAG5086460.1 CUT1 family carbohydrate ABC transporter, TC 3.A.1.1.-, membrane protein [Thermobacillus xylanilyticus]